MRFNEIRQWAADRNLILGSDPTKQMLKLTEEVGELADALLEEDRCEALDGVGDAAVVLTILAAQLGYRIEDALLPLWDVEPTEGPAREAMLLSAGIGRLAAAIARGKTDKAQAEISNCMRILAGTATGLGVGIDLCIERAWREIKDRKGRMVSGVFIKEEA